MNAQKARRAQVSAALGTVATGLIVLGMVGCGYSAPDSGVVIGRTYDDPDIRTTTQTRTTTSRIGSRTSTSRITEVRTVVEEARWIITVSATTGDRVGEQRVSREVFDTCDDDGGRMVLTWEIGDSCRPLVVNR